MITFYNQPWDGPTAAVVEHNCKFYDIRKDGYGGFTALPLYDDEVAECFELDEQEVDMFFDEESKELILRACENCK